MSTGNLELWCSIYAAANKGKLQGIQILHIKIEFEDFSRMESDFLQLFNADFSFKANHSHVLFKLVQTLYLCVIPVSSKVDKIKNQVYRDTESQAPRYKCVIEN